MLHFCQLTEHLRGAELILVGKPRKNGGKTGIQNGCQCERTWLIAKLRRRLFAIQPEEPGLGSRCNWSFQLHIQDFCKRQEGHRN